MSQDWREPIRAHHEETYWLSPFGDVDRGNRWFVDSDGYERIRLGMACMHCLTPFPAPVGDVFDHWWETADFNWPYGKVDGMKLVRAGYCPICKVDARPEILETQLTKPHRVGDEIRDPVKR